MESTATRIVLDCVMSSDGLPDHLRRLTAGANADHSHAVQMASDFVKQVIEECMEDSYLPEFAQQILRLTLDSHVDWSFIGERLLSQPEHN
jgi:hypothetical protein